MEKQFKHKKTGEIISYKEGIIKSGSFVLEIGCEPSTEYWEEITEKSVLFITEDGVDIRENDTYYYVDDYWEIFFIQKAVSTSGRNGFIYFSTKQAAENYIICNKPCLSFNDVWNIGDNKSSDNNYIVISKKQLKELAKTKVDL